MPAPRHSADRPAARRFTRVDRDLITYEAVIEDPKVFTKPWTVRTTLRLREGARARRLPAGRFRLRHRGRRLGARSNTIEELRPLVPQVLEAFATAKRRAVTMVGA